MNSTVFSAQTLTEEKAQELAEAYIKGDKDPPKIALILGVDSFDLNLLMHPMVRSKIQTMQRALKPFHTLHEHMEELKRIRDAAFGDDNWKVALAAETQLGKAAGHYDPKPPGDSDDIEDLDPEKAKKLSSDELRRKLAKLAGAVIPVSDQPHALPEPTSPEALDDDEVGVDEI